MMNNPRLKITKSVTADIPGFVTVIDLQRLIAQVPEDASVSITHYDADPGDQRERSFTKLTITWTD